MWMLLKKYLGRRENEEQKRWTTMEVWLIEIGFGPIKKLRSGILKGTKIRSIRVEA